MIESAFSPERSVSSTIAMGKIMEFLAQTGLKLSIVESDSKKQVTHIEILKGNEVASAGSGKGVEHCFGAICEAIEHYLFESFVDEKVPATSEFILNQDFVKYENIINRLVLPDSIYKAVTFNNYNNNQKIYLPSDLVSWNHEYENFYIRKYFSNSGVALGMTYEDTVLHGLNEIIERHEVSVFLKQYLLDANISSNKYKIILSDKKDCLTILTRSMFGPYVAISFNPKQDFNEIPIFMYGGGASLCPHYAILRSETELRQCVALYDGNEKKHDFIALNNLREYSKIYSNVIKTPDLSHLNMTRLTPVKLPNAKEQIGMIHKGVLEQNRDIFVRNIVEDKSIYVVQTYVPGLDKFNLILSGSIVAPLNRVGDQDVI